jgi:hypothetical protein
METQFIQELENIRKFYPGDTATLRRPDGIGGGASGDPASCRASLTLSLTCLY